MAANQNVSIQSQGLDNTSGQIGSVQGSLTIDAQKEKLLNTSGSLQAGTSLKITSGGLNNDSALFLRLPIIQLQALMTSAIKLEKLHRMLTLQLQLRI